jgi:hypothetical protein
MPPVTVAYLRASFPEFTSTTKYPDSMVNFWLEYACLFLPRHRWGRAYSIGLMLYVAHNLTLEGLAGAEGKKGAPPGMTVGPIVSKTVGELTINYDAALGMIESDGHWSMTFYGTRFVKLARQIGSGWEQIGIGRAPIGSPGSVGYPMGLPWVGPVIDLGWGD